MADVHVYNNIRHIIAGLQRSLHSVNGPTHIGLVEGYRGWLSFGCRSSFERYCGWTVQCGCIFHLLLLRPILHGLPTLDGCQMEFIGRCGKHWNQGSREERSGRGERSGWWRRRGRSGHERCHASLGRTHHHFQASHKCVLSPINSATLKMTRRYP